MIIEKTILMEPSKPNNPTYAAVTLCKFRFSIDKAQTAPTTINFRVLNIHGWLCITKLDPTKISRYTLIIGTFS